MIIVGSAFKRLWKVNGKIVPSFVTFSPGFPNNVPSTVSPAVSGKVLPYIEGKSAKKVGTILPLSYQPLLRGSCVPRIFL